MPKNVTPEEIQSMALFAELNPEPVFRFNRQGVILQSNPAANQLFKKESLEGDQIKNILLETRELDMDVLIEQDKVQNLMISLHDKTYRFVFRGISKLQVCQIYGADISDKIEAQEKAESMALFAELNPEPVLRANARGIIVQANQAARSAFQVELLEEHNILDLVEEISRVNLPEMIENDLISTIDAKVGERMFRFILRGISRLEVCQVYGSDITKRVEAQQKIESMALFARLNPEPVLRFDKKGIILQANPAADNSLHQDHIEGMHVKDLFPGLKDMDIPSFIKNDRVEAYDIDNGEKIYRFILKGISGLGVCQIYGSDITKRVKAEQKVLKQQEAITDSIYYARRIQQAVLPDINLLEENFAESFVLFKPRDIVSGDFYWMTRKGSKIIVVAADSTGHGVPGAFMSMLGVSFLNEIVNTNDCCADLLLNLLRDKVKAALSQSGKGTDDGMDLAMIIYDPKEKQIHFAGAYNHFYLLRNGELHVTKADRMPIGNHLRDTESFTNHLIKVQKGDTVYLFSDGYPDQFDVTNKKKFTVKRMKEMFLDHYQKPMAEQKEVFDKTFEDWRGNNPQIDDVLLMGMRL